jgi:hypothetical protein
VPESSKFMTMPNAPSLTSTNPTSDETVRMNIANRVLLYGMISITAIAVIVTILGILVFIKAPTDDKGTDMIISVFHSLLPVVATWVGTVIAFYFGKANFEAASKAATDLVKQFANSDDKLQATKVTDPGVMRKLADIIFNNEILGKKDEEIMVEDNLINFIDKNNKGDRLPILDSKNVARYIIHESTLDEFARKLPGGVVYPQLKDRALASINLGQLINDSDPDMKNKVTNSITFISINATLLEAKKKMDDNQWSQDAIVTENGLASEPVIGWITNNKISDWSKV